MKALHGILGLLLLAFTGSAQAVPLTDLLNGGSITIGDKLFDDWTAILESTSDGHTVDTDNIDVTALADNGSGYGLQFDILNDEFFVQGDDLYAYTNFSFGFHVSVLDPAYQINDASLELLQYGTARRPDGTNDIGSYILENIGTASLLDDLGVIDAEHSVLDEVVFTDPGGSVNFDPQSEIWVTKNLFVWATDSTDNAHLDSFNQRFSQVRVPEPSTWLLTGLGLVAVGAVHRRRKV